MIDPGSGGPLHSPVSGTPLRVVRPCREEVHVSARSDGVLPEWPAHDGDLGDAGDPLARPYPEVSA